MILARRSFAVRALLLTLFVVVVALIGLQTNVWNFLQSEGSHLLGSNEATDENATFQSGTLMLDAPVSAVAFSPNAQVIAVGLSTGVIELRSVPDGSLIRSLVGHTSEIRTLAFSPDGQVLASGWGQESKLNDPSLQIGTSAKGKDTSIRLWRVSDGSLLRTLAGDPLGARALAFSKDGHILAAGGRDRRVVLWTLPGGTLLKALPARPAPDSGWPDVMRLAYDDTGQSLTVAYGDNSVERWSTTDFQLLAQQQADVQTWDEGNGNEDVRSIDLSHNGKMIATATYRATIFLRQLSDGAILHKLGSFDPVTGDWIGHIDTICALAFNPSDKWIASGGCERISDDLTFQDPDMSVRIWRVADGKVLGKLNAQKASVRSIVWSPNGKLLVFGGDDQTVRLWEVK